LLSNVGDEQISSLSEQIRNRLDREDAKLDMATDRLSDQIDDAVRGGEIERQLEERRKRLLGAAGGDGGGATDAGGSSSSSS